MLEYEYDVAISFAGEQRDAAEAIAQCLRQAGLKVFYDKYEQGTLWGKDLYEHLADVYQHKARYCLILISAEYAAKIWTTHERRNAQARALVNKSEYILPVRFDDTELPGLPDTVGYLRFAEQGATGICNLLLGKLGRSASEGNLTQRKVTSSPRAFILDAEQKLQAYIPVEECMWGGTAARLVLQPDDPTDGAFLNALRVDRHSVLVAFKHNVGRCKVEDVQHILKGGLDQWAVRLQVEPDALTPTMEIAMPGLSADEIAEQRARRILLDDHPYKEGTAQGLAFYNDAAKEVLIRGLGAPIKPTGSPFPALYKYFWQKPTKFLEIAWITAVFMLKMSGAVAEVTSLSLGIDGTGLLVEFTGRRRKEYTDRPAITITVNGVCALTKDTTR